MKKALIFTLLLIMALSICGCEKLSDSPCSMCGEEVAYLYDNELGIGEEKLSLCKDCHEEFVESVNAVKELLADYQ